MIVSSAAKTEALTKLSNHLTAILYERAMLQADSRDEEVVRNLCEIFTVHSGWDWFRTEPRLLNLADRKAITMECISSVLHRYEQAYSTVDDPELYKSPETIKMLLS